MNKKDGNNFDTQTEDMMDTIIYASVKSLLLVMLVVLLIAVGIPLVASIFTVEAEAAELPAITESCGLSEEELSGALKGKLAEEIADSEIMIEQLIRILDNRELVEIYKDFKLKRLEYKLEDEDEQR